MWIGGIAAVVVVVVVLAIALTRPPSLTITQFVSQANTICHNLSNTFQNLSKTNSAALVFPNERPSSSNLATIGSSASQELSIYQGFDSQLKALGSPPSNQASWSQALASLDKADADLQAGQSAAQADNLSAVATAENAFYNDANRFDQLAHNVGACSSSGASPSPT